MRVFMLLTACTAILLAGCAARGEWDPIAAKVPLNEALAECRFQRAKVSGYDWVDAALRRSEVMDACMLKYGYYCPGGKICD